MCCLLLRREVSEYFKAASSCNLQSLSFRLAFVDINKWDQMGLPAAIRIVPLPGLYGHWTLDCFWQDHLLTNYVWRTMPLMLGCSTGKADSKFLL